MATRLNPNTLKRIERKSERFEFHDPNQEQPWVLHLRRPNDLELALSADLADKLIQQYVEGGWIDDAGKYHAKPEPYYSNGEPLIVSATSIRIACRLAVMQDPEAPENESYEDPMEILELVPYYPVAWKDIMAKQMQLFQGTEPAPKGS